MLTDQQKPQFKIKIKRDKKEKKKGFGIERKHRMRVERKNKRNIAQGVIKGYNRRTHLSSKKETLFFVFWLCFPGQMQHRFRYFTWKIVKSAFSLRLIYLR